ncbi:MAG TPA: prolipoprotein diacylglyceryl transferase [Candidatus Magasanikbacteria bacterium]|nr:prolipoprotein diacylglyceryl transferase [Candidatus Magasanikbacteria bacterium]
MFTNNINPILFNWGIINIRWYGLFLAIGVGLSVWLITKLFKQNKLSTNLAFDLCTWLIIGGLIGARLGEILFYEPLYYFSHPLEMIMINHGGLSSHGMTIGLLITFFLFIKSKKIDWKNILDFVIIPIPLLASFIRIGNFFNSEIVGKATNLPWGVYFPNYESNPILRHPSQIYEAIIAITVYYLLFTIYKKYQNKLPPLFITHLFLLLYFTSRFMIEFVKEFSTYFGLTTGQWLSVPFVLWGVGWFVYAKVKK